MSGGGRASQAAETRSRLVSVSRELFAGQGYAGTSTEQVLANAGVARGALYHHFKDKADLFAAVCEALHAEAAAITAVVTAEAEQGTGALGRLLAGCDA
jgi:AcrR family transcriptional regulator